ncbi:MAG: hypothetical protein ABMB14_27610 [Myxococcota bacterium]
MSHPPAPSWLGLALLSAVGCTKAPLADPDAISSMWDGDADCVRSARRDGRALAGSGVVLRVPSDAPWARDLSRDVFAGVGAARRFLATHGLDAGGGIEILVCDRAVIGHAPGGPFVFLSVAMVEQGRAPWLHESLHVLLRGDRDWLTDVDEATADRDMPLWLVEGLPDYVAQSVAESTGVGNPGPFVTSLAEVDRACGAARTEGPPEIFEQVGRPGRSEALFGPERFENAQVFYPCSDSFVRWLAERHGLEALLAASSATPDELATWERRTGARLEHERALWVEHLL